MCVCMCEKKQHVVGVMAAEFLVLVALHTFPMLCYVSQLPPSFCLFSAYSASERTGCVRDRRSSAVLILFVCFVLRFHKISQTTSTVPSTTSARPDQ